MQPYRDVGLLNISYSSYPPRHTVHLKDYTVINISQALLRHVRHSCVFFLLFALSFTTQAAVLTMVRISQPSATSTGTYIVAWNGGQQSTELYENNIRVATAASSGNYTAPNKPAGTYTYYVHDCAPCVDSAPLIVQVNPATGGTGGAGETYEYDVLGRLTKVKMDGVVKTVYSYDKAGNRTTVTE